jgi:hypothetical protein
MPKTSFKSSPSPLTPSVTPLKTSKNTLRVRTKTPPTGPFSPAKPTDVNKVASLFGVIYFTEKGVIDHNMRTAVLGRDQKLVKIFTGNDWKPGEVASLVRDLVNP